MSVECYLLLSISCVSLSGSAVLGWMWTMPTALSVARRPVNAQLERAGELGFDSSLWRRRLNAIEIAIVLVVLCCSWLYWGWPLGVTALLIVFHCRRRFLQYLIDKREKLLRGQILELVNALESLCTAGHGLHKALQLLAETMPHPIHEFLRKIRSDVRHGRPLPEALTSVRHQLKLDAFSLLSATLCRQDRFGSTFVDALAGIRATLQSRHDIEQQIIAKTAGPRSQMFVLSIFPFVFLSLLGLTLPDAVSLLFLNPYGKMVLVAVMWLTYSGIVIGNRLIKVGKEGSQ